MTEEFTNELSPSGEPFAKQSGLAPEASVVPETALEAESAPESFEAGFPGSASFDMPSDPPSVPPLTSADGAEAPLRIAVSALSDVGCVRTNNEDPSVTTRLLESMWFATAWAEWPAAKSPAPTRCRPL